MLYDIRKDIQDGKGGTDKEDTGISDEEAYRVFNMGVGMVWFVAPEFAEKCLELAGNLGFRAFVFGEVTEGERKSLIV